MKKILASSLLGNIVEYYDFGIYAVFATTIGKLFFPPVDDSLSVILALLVFSFGFMMRPLGGLVFGYIGDKFGRKKALIISMLGMSFSTLSLGLLPSYEEIGIFASIILILIRLLQGLCIGGEGTGSAIYIIEHGAGKRIALMGGFIMTSNILGTLLANLVAFLLNEFFGLDDTNWSWAFFLGFFMGIIVLYLRIKNHETPAFEKFKEKKQSKIPLVEVLAKKKYALFSTIAIAASATSLMYLVRGYLNLFLQSHLGFSTDLSLQYTIYTLISLTILLPLAGFLTDKIGTNKVLNLGITLTFFGILPAWYLIITQENIILGLFLISFMGALMGAPAYPHAINSFPPEIRYSGIALGWNLGNAIFGGTTPLIATLALEKIGMMGPAFYLLFTASIFLLLRFWASLYSKKIKKNLEV
jgi:MHS family proline/betaine transporter-like MFS transporter